MHCKAGNQGLKLLGSHGALLLTHLDQRLAYTTQIFIGNIVTQHLCGLRHLSDGAIGIQQNVSFLLGHAGTFVSGMVNAGQQVIDTGMDLGIFQIHGNAHGSAAGANSVADLAHGQGFAARHSTFQTVCSGGHGRNGAGYRHIDMIGDLYINGNAYSSLYFSYQFGNLLGQGHTGGVTQGNDGGTVFFCGLGSLNQEGLLGAGRILGGKFNIGAVLFSFSHQLTDLDSHLFCLYMIGVLHLHGGSGHFDLQAGLLRVFYAFPGLCHFLSGKTHRNCQSTILHILCNGLINDRIFTQVFDRGQFHGIYAQRIGTNCNGRFLTKQ